MTDAEYRTLILEARKKQLQSTLDYVERLEVVYTAAAASLASKLESMSDEDLRRQPTESLIAQMNAELDNLRSDTAKLLGVGMTDLAQAAADREKIPAVMSGAPGDARLIANTIKLTKLSDGFEISVKFGQLARSAVQVTADRVYADGYKLSDRLYKLDTFARQQVSDTIVQGVAEQVSARELAGRIRSTMAAAGVDCPRFRAATIAQTEINNAHREAHYLSLFDADGNKKSYVAGVGWRLSPSHPKACYCDILASDDPDDLGAGNYAVDDAPSAPHPRCLCFTVTLLVDFPDLQFPGKAPSPEDVPATLLKETDS